MKNLTLPRLAILTGVLAFSAFPMMISAATLGPGDPSPIGHSGSVIAFGPGDPSPIGHSGSLVAFGPGDPSPIGPSGTV